MLKLAIFMATPPFAGSLSQSAGGDSSGLRRFHEIAGLSANLNRIATLSGQSERRDKQEWV
jgi:hypothetical protein